MATNYNNAKFAPKVNILGQDYEIFLDRVTDEDNPKYKDCYGYIELYAKEIHIQDVPVDEFTILKSEEHTKKILRHEIVHGFVHESGMAGYMTWNEETVCDFISMQMTKICKAYMEAGAL